MRSGALFWLLPGKLRKHSPPPAETDGEAANPGPRGSHRRFRNIWRIATVNPTTWSAMVPILARQRFDLLVGQEMLRRADTVDRAMVEGNRAGYHTFMQGSVTTDKGGCSAGVAIAARWAHGITSPRDERPGQPPPPPPAHRFAFQHWHAVFSGGIGIGSAYLHMGVDAAAQNEVLPRAITAYVKAWGKPFIVGGDWQMSPEDLVRAGWPDLMGARVVHSKDFTYASGPDRSQLDYFLVEHSIAAAVRACRAQDEVSVSKHRLVWLELGGSLKQQSVWRLRRPKPLPTSVPVGPPPPPPSWDGFAQRAAKVKGTEGLSDLYGEFRARAVPELLGLLQVQEQRKPAEFLDEPRWLQVGAVQRCAGYLLKPKFSTTRRRLEGKARLYLDFVVAGSRRNATDIWL